MHFWLFYIHMQDINIVQFYCLDPLKSPCHCPLRSSIITQTTKLHTEITEKLIYNYNYGEADFSSPYYSLMYMFISYLIFNTFKDCIGIQYTLLGIGEMKCGSPIA